jgi:transposase InsO family protein
VLKDGALYHKANDTGGGEGLLVPLIASQRIKLTLEAIHNGDINGHPGVRMMYYTLKSRCYWPGMSADINRFVAECAVCDRAKSRRSLSIPALPMPIPSTPFDIIGVDAMAMPTAVSGANTVVVFTDYLTRWVEAGALKCKKAGTPSGDEVAHLFIDLVVSRHGLPKKILSDQGKPFCEGIMAEVYKKLDIEKLQTSPYHPQANGLVERFNRTLLALFDYNARNRGSESWDVRLPLVLLAYRAHYHTTVRRSPFFMLYGRLVNLPLDLIYGSTHSLYSNRYEYLQEHVSMLPLIWQDTVVIFKRKAQEIREETAKLLDEKKVEQYHVGEVVYLFDEKSLSNRVDYKLSPKYRGPYVIHSVISLATYEIRDPVTGNTYIVWAGHLRRSNSTSVTRQVRRETASVPVGTRYSRGHPHRVIPSLSLSSSSPIIDIIDDE